MTAINPRSVESHFAFGENWRSFVRTVDEDSVNSAEQGMAKLLPNGELQGKRLLDIGCGSGLSMLASHNLGATEVVGVDIDPSSVAAARALLGRYLGEGWSVSLKSVFNLDPAVDGTYEIVHSWGVLHHTGDMWEAVRKAAAMVAPGGYFVVALYQKTPYCGFWKVEKKIYSSAPAVIQALLRGLYRAAYALACLLRGTNPLPILAGLRTSRGMNAHHDLHDWMGGYPYESASPEEVHSFLGDLGFTMVRSFTKQRRGLTGSGCDEFVALKQS